MAESVKLLTLVNDSSVGKEVADNLFSSTDQSQIDEIALTKFTLSFLAVKNLKASKALIEQVENRLSPSLIEVKFDENTLIRISKTALINFCLLLMLIISKEADKSTCELYKQLIGKYKVLEKCSDKDDNNNTKMVRMHYSN